jgi:hypothetical protein
MDYFWRSRGGNDACLNYVLIDAPRGGGSMVTIGSEGTEELEGWAVCREAACIQGLRYPLSRASFASKVWGIRRATVGDTGQRSNAQWDDLATLTKCPKCGLPPYGCFAEPSHHENSCNTKIF